MTPEKLLEAMTDLEDYDIMTAKKTTVRRRGGTRKFTVLVAAVVALMAIGLTAFAAVNGAEWFHAFFTEKNKGELSQGQQDYIGESSKDIGLSATQDGYTITVESAITDGYTAYMKLLLEAPEGTVLDAEGGYFNVMQDAPYFYPLNEGEHGTGEWKMLEDENKQDNKVGILIIQNGSGFLGGNVWRLELVDLEAYYDFGTPSEIIAKGTWSFDITFKDIRVEEVQLLSEPMPYKAETSGTGQESNDREITLTSVCLRPMSGTIILEGEGESLPLVGFGKLAIVMKDGSTVNMGIRLAGEGRYEYDMNVPIDLEEVDHVLLPDGTKLHMP